MLLELSALPATRVGLQKCLVWLVPLKRQAAKPTYEANKMAVHPINARLESSKWDCSMACHRGPFYAGPKKRF